ncbi:MAG: MazG nucleotide pyrophosphohydrolase domain-containing protein, partial [Chloroflexota bacterium]
RKAGFDWPDIQGVYDKLQEEIGEVQTATTESHRREELGDLLFVTVNLASWLGIDAEIALREANLKFETRFRVLEEAALERNINLKESSIDELDVLWNLAKARVG